MFATSCLANLLLPLLHPQLILSSSQQLLLQKDIPSACSVDKDSWRSTPSSLLFTFSSSILRNSPRWWTATLGRQRIGRKCRLVAQIFHQDLLIFQLFQNHGVFDLKLAPSPLHCYETVDTPKLVSSIWWVVWSLIFKSFRVRMNLRKMGCRKQVCSMTNLKWKKEIMTAKLSVWIKESKLIVILLM